MITDFNEKGHPMVFSDASTNTDELKNKCRAAIFSLTRQHGGAERLAEACFMIAQSELENNWQQRAESAEAKLAELEKQEEAAWTSKANLDALKSEPGKTLEFMTRDKSIYSNPVPLFTRPAPAINLTEMVPTVCDGKEQEAFEEYARKKGFDLSQHPLHYLFLDGKTNQARSAWRECLVYVRAAILRNIEEAK